MRGEERYKCEEDLTDSQLSTTTSRTTTSIMKTNQESNIWSNVYWNQVNSENDQNIANTSQPPSAFQTPYQLQQMKSGPFGSSSVWNSSGPTSLPMTSSEPKSFNLYDFEMEKSYNNNNSGPNSMLFLGQQSKDFSMRSHCGSEAASRTSSMSSQAWGDMLDNVIMDEVSRMKQNNSGSFSSLNSFSMQY